MWQSKRIGSVKMGYTVISFLFHHSYSKQKKLQDCRLNITDCYGQPLFLPAYYETRCKQLLCALHFQTLSNSLEQFLPILVRKNNCLKDNLISSLEKWS